MYGFLLVSQWHLRYFAFSFPVKCCHVALAPCSLSIHMAQMMWTHSWHSPAHQLHQTTEVTIPTATKSGHIDTANHHGGLGAPTLFSQKGTKTSWAPRCGEGSRDLIWMCKMSNGKCEGHRAQLQCGNMTSFAFIIENTIQTYTSLNVYKIQEHTMATRMYSFQKAMKTTLALIPCSTAVNLSNSWHPSPPCWHFVASGGRGPLKRSWFLRAVKSRDVDWRIHISSWTDSRLQILQLLYQMRSCWTSKHLSRERQGKITISLICKTKKNLNLNFTC